MVTMVSACRSVLWPALSWLMARVAYGQMAAIDSSQSVLKRYTNADCTKSGSTGDGVQQSWIRKDTQVPYCYDITAGPYCNFRCHVRMACDYGTGSGLKFHFYDSGDCTGAASSSMDMAPDLTWMEAVSFFNGSGCAPQGVADTVSYLRFLSPVTSYPNCSAFGAVGGAEAAYETSYEMQFYSDIKCANEYQLTTFSTLTESSFKFWLHRGSQYCYDYVDSTPKTGNVSVRDRVGKNMMNFRLVCGNPDGLGNGIMILPYLFPA
ncbi:unnamed protein product [Polarella glacialis]|uniref:Uncharacterized protein n=1 Tax=Polarella glacialis TaxID=89957 RepID=A0A813HVW8_POLGL|nr:unnamed protein product [Polarella glacialis]